MTHGKAQKALDELGFTRELTLNVTADVARQVRETLFPYEVERLRSKLERYLLEVVKSIL